VPRPPQIRKRTAGWAALFALLAAVLTACQKPLPTITVSGDGKSVVVDAANYRFADGPLHEPVKDVGQAPELRVRAGSTLLVDVPRTVADNAWVVAAFTLDSAGKSHPLTGAGTASAIHDRHTTHLATTPAGVGSYYLQVAEIRSASQVGGWILHVTTTE
jgi:hypothetical protein